MKKHEVVVIGSGPAGKTAAIYLGRAGLKPLVLTGINNAGGALMNTTDIENFPGFENGIAGPDLIQNMQAQAEKFGAEFEMDEVEEFDFSSETKILKTMMGETIEAKAVVLALGCKYRKLGCEGEAEFAGRGVSYCATCDGAFFKDKELVVVGGGDTAMEEAIYLTHFATKVTIIHRRDIFRASKVMLERAQNHPKIEFLVNSVVEKITSETGQNVEKIIIKNTLTSEESELNCQGVFVAIGVDPSTSLLEGKIEMKDGYVLTDLVSSKTNVEGVFAAGDCIDPDYRQAIVAAGSGAKAGIDCERWLGERACKISCEDDGENGK